MTCGVYMILNTVTFDRYVGSSVDIEARWKQHQASLRQGFGNKVMQAAWNRHGEASFKLVLLLELPHERLATAEKALVGTAAYNRGPVGAHAHVRPEAYRKAQQALARKQERQRAAAGKQQLRELEKQQRQQTAEERRQLREAEKARRHAARLAREEARRRTVLGVTGNLRELCEHFGVEYETLRWRRKQGMTLKEALTQPVRRAGRTPGTFVAGGKQGTLRELCDHFGMRFETVRKRLKRGWDLERALTQAPREQ